MKKLNNAGFLAKTFLLLGVTALGFASCSSSDPVTPGEDTFSLSANTYEVELGEVVTFKVTLNGDDVTASSEIKNITSGATLDGATFSSDVAGTFNFRATRGDLTSETRTITVTGEPEEGVTVLVPDKNFIFNNNTDVVSFTVKFNGTDVTGDESTTIRNVTAGENLVAVNGVYTFSSTNKGVYVFVAEYDGEVSEEVEVNVDGQFYKQIGFVKFTNYGCEPCTAYDTKYHEAVERYPDRVAKMSVHVDGPWKNDPNLYEDWRYLLVDYFGYPTQVPNGSYDLREDLSSGETSTAIMNRLANFVDEYPANTGFYSTVSRNGTKLTANITVKATETHNYWLVVGLLEDCIGWQIDYGDGYQLDDTLKVLATDIEGDDLGVIDAGKSVTKTYEIEIPEEVNFDATKIMVYTIYQEGGEMVMGNAAHLSVFGTTNYRYEAE